MIAQTRHVLCLKPAKIHFLAEVTRDWFWDMLDGF